MTTKELVTIGGPPGSGTTTVAKILEEILGLKHEYLGAIFREMAQEYGMSLEEFSTYAENHPEIDKELDRRAVEMARKGGIILEGRLAGWMVHRHGIRAFKIWIDADERERARRVVERDGGTIEENMVRMKVREESERRRYLEIYGIDISDLNIYDLVVDSTFISPQKVAEIIINKYKEWNNRLQRA